MNFSTIEPDGWGDGTEPDTQCYLFGEPWSCPAIQPLQDPEGAAKRESQGWRLWMASSADWQSSSGSRTICTKQVCIKQATGVFTSVVERHRQGKRGCIRFERLTHCWPRSYLSTLTFFFCLAVRSKHSVPLGHIFTCCATLGWVSAMQCPPFSALQHPWVFTDRV